MVWCTTDVSLSLLCHLVYEPIISCRPGDACRADSRLAPSQWQTWLQSNAVSHWLGTNLESALCMQSSGNIGILGSELHDEHQASTWIKDNLLSVRTLGTYRNTLSMKSVLKFKILTKGMVSISSYESKLFYLGVNEMMYDLSSIMSSSHGNLFCITDPLWREPTSHQWIPLTNNQ